MTSSAASALVLVLLAVAGCTRAVPAAESGASAAQPGGTGVRPFHVGVPDAALVELRQRIAATRWPDRETVGDRSQGAQLAKLQELLRYWGTGYDWRKLEARLNALPQFVTTIDGVDIHFIHVRSRHPNAMPVILTHGWPGSRRGSSCTRASRSGPGTIPESPRLGIRCSTTSRCTG